MFGAPSGAVGDANIAGWAGVSGAWAMAVFSMVVELMKGKD